MKKNPSPVPFPTTRQEEERWGFDIWKPKGTPMAWVLDWDSAQAGSGISRERLKDIREFNIAEDLSALCSDDLFAICSDRLKYLWNNFLKQYEQIHGEASTIEFVKAYANIGVGSSSRNFLEQKWGSPLSLKGIAWHQDCLHMQFGPASKPYLWFDEEKVVCTRTECMFRPPEGMEGNVKYCLAYEDAHMVRDMKNSPALFHLLGPHLGPDDRGRCVHIWTYNKSVIDAMPLAVRSCQRESVRQVLRSKGIQI